MAKGSGLSRTKAERPQLDKAHVKEVVVGLKTPRSPAWLAQGSWSSVP